MNIQLFLNTFLLFHYIELLSLSPERITIRIIVNSLYTIPGHYQNEPGTEELQMYKSPSKSSQKVHHHCNIISQLSYHLDTQS